VKLRLIALCLLLFLHAPLTADEGMWLFNRPPRELLQKKYDFKLTDDWLTNAQKASVRFPGGSGGFVSPHGLVVTNHHVGADRVLKLSTRGKDLYRDGFHAARYEDELKCLGLELDVLQEIVDVSDQVRAAVTKEMSPAEAAAARRVVVARIAKESEGKTGLRSEVVVLYRGAEYHLYLYRRYSDVRLVMAPEAAVAGFGGDVDNFEYPRHDLDVTFFRVYENGKPVQTPNHFKWSTKGPTPGDLVFVTGHPGTTNRLETLAHLKHRRDVTLPYQLFMLRQREALYSQFAQKGPEQKLAVQSDLHRVANARKAFTGQFHGLLNPEILAAKAKLEKELRDSDNGKNAAKAWLKIEDSFKTLADIEKRYYLIERGDAFDSQLFKMARHFVRLSDELAKDDGKRLPEYRSGALKSLRSQLSTPGPIAADLERAKLAGSLAFLAENLGADHPLVVEILAGKGPAERADELIGKTKLTNFVFRERLLEGDKDFLARSDDPLIKLARQIDPAARKLREPFDLVAEVHQQAYAEVALTMFASQGAAIAPDATFTLRLAFGVVKGYNVDGADLRPFTTFGDLYKRSAEQGNVDPFELPKRWLEGKGKIDPAVPLNFVSTADTIGGNSGSPVLNQAGELVGVNFDRNRHGLVRNFVYTEVQARHICVHSRGVLEVLDKLYHADNLVRELTEGK
jgi:hypothetical protein